VGLDRAWLARGGASHRDDGRATTGSGDARGGRPRGCRRDRSIVPRAVRA
jgi:hypothetical protein